MSVQSLETYSVGIATGDITPSVGAPLCGFAARGLHTSTGVYHPLRTVAVAVEDGSTTVIVLSAEIVFFEGIADRVRMGIAQATGVPGDRILLVGTHTHCGPAMRPQDADRHGWVDQDYVHHAVTVMARTAHTAWKNRYPARLEFGIGRASFAVSRRKPDPAGGGRVLWAPDPEGPHDHEVSILAVRSLDGVVRGILFSYACHPTSRGGLRIGGDYPGFACDRIEESFDNAQPCFLQGCGADQKPMPADPRATTFVPRSVEQTGEIGRELGDAVVRTIQAGGLRTVAGAMAMRRSVVDLRTEPLDRAMVASELSKPEMTFRKRWALHHQARLDAGLPEERDVPMEIQTLRFGDSLAVVALAAEAVVEHALRMKRELRAHFADVLPLGYANAVIGYVPVRRQLDGWGYEVIDANQHRKRTGRFLPETEDLIHRTVAGMLGVPPAG